MMIQWPRRRNESVVGSAVAVSVFFVALLVGFRVSAQMPDLEATARGYPVLRDMAGKKLADGDFTQRLEGGQLHVRIIYHLGHGGRIEEKAVFRQRPQLLQEGWSWTETRDGKVYRQFEVNFKSGNATSRKREANGFKQWSKAVKIQPGRTFAGFGFTMAIKNLRARLTKGERVELEAIAFTPQPRLARVEISHGGLDQIRMADRRVKADHFVIHPKIPWVARLFVRVPDTHIWLSSPAPAGFLRFEGPMVEPSDSAVRVDLLPGGRSEPAQPVIGRR